jgi:Flp pilus assembly pilin Flp
MIVRRMWARITTQFNDEQGASLVEYALLISLIALVAFAAVALLGVALADEYSQIANTMA